MQPVWRYRDRATLLAWYLPAATDVSEMRSHGAAAYTADATKKREDEMKYRLLHDDTYTLLGRTYYRIQCVTPFADVKAGDLGGYIEGEHNLAHRGRCWVYDNARVCDQAKVRGNARVKNNAWVSGNARVEGDALVADNAVVCENATVTRAVRVYDNARVEGESRVYSSARVYGNAVVSGKSEVGGNARVYGCADVKNSRVSDDAQVYEYARLCDARVEDDARVYGEAGVSNGTVKDSAKVYDNATVTGVVFEYASVGGSSRVHGGLGGVAELSGAAVIWDGVELPKTWTYSAEASPADMQASAPCHVVTLTNMDPAAVSITLFRNRSGGVSYCESHFLNSARGVYGSMDAFFEKLLGEDVDIRHLRPMLEAVEKHITDTPHCPEAVQVYGLEDDD